jgi:uncharacterized protein (UPF0335 family)
VQVVGQAQLDGFIERIEELGLELVSLQQNQEPPCPSAKRDMS